MTATTLSPREMKRLRKQGADYVSPSPYTVRAAFRRGDLFTKLSAVVFGLGDIVRKQYVKGIAMLALEIAYFVFMQSMVWTIFPSCRPWAPMQAARSWSTASGSTPNLTVPWSSCCTVSPLWLSPLLHRPVGHVRALCIQVPGAARGERQAPSFMDDVRELLDAKRTFC